MSTMTIRGVDVDDDWLFGAGLGSYRTGEAAIEQNIQTALQCFLNDAFWDMNFGVDWFNLIGARNPAAEANILVQTRGIIIGCFGVAQINSVDASMNTLTRALSITYNVTTIYSTTITGTATVP